MALDVGSNPAGIQTRMLVQFQPDALDFRLKIFDIQPQYGILKAQQGQLAKIWDTVK